MLPTRSSSPTLFNPPYTQSLKEWSAERYVQNSSPQLKHALEILNRDQWFENLVIHYDSLEPIYILDIGCGDGKITAGLAKQYPHVQFVGVDISESMIEFAKNNFKREEFPNLEFFCRDATDSELPKVLGRKFHCILSFSTIHWIKNQLQLYTNIHALTSDSAKICIMFYSKDQYLWEAIRKTAISDEWKKYFPNYETPYYGGIELKQLLSDNEINFSNDEVSQHYIQDGRGQLIKYLTGITPIYAPLKVALEQQQVSREEINKDIQKFLSDVVQNIIQKENGTFIENENEGTAQFNYTREVIRGTLTCHMKPTYEESSTEAFRSVVRHP